MKIGVFDSGVGGLTVLRELRRYCPGHSTIYLGDTARVPYGTKSPQTVRRYAELNAEFLLSQGVDYLVIACNTASAFAMDALQGLTAQVTGVIEPGAQLAVRATEGEDTIGVLGTAGTIGSGAYEAAIRELRPRAKVTSIACPMFVPLAEEGWTEGEIAQAIARKYLKSWTDEPEATPAAVILGCTHYPLLKPMLQEVLGSRVALIDSAEAVAQHVQTELGKDEPEAEPTHRLCLTDASDGFVRLSLRLLKDLDEKKPVIEWVDLESSPRVSPA